VDPDRFLLLVGLGIAVGTYGTLIGSGGGFILVPVLLFLYPGERTGTITSISLAVVFVNALSGSLAQTRAGRIHFRTATIFAIAALPGSVLGALFARQLPRGWFDVLFGLLLIALSAYLMSGRATKQTAGPSHVEISTRDLQLGAPLSVAIGFLSSAFGIGGGVMHVPLMARLLRFPFAVAAATSQYVLMFMSLAGTLTHILAGEFQTGWRRTGALSLGVLVGAQIGVLLSTRVGGTMLTRLLSAALLIVGIRLALSDVL
jgi:uncharacterized membrane protein YfcA